MQTRGPSEPSNRRDRTLIAATVAAAAAAALAPAGLTGNGLVDGVERALVAAACTFVGAHGRRLPWIISGGLVVGFARGPALAIGLVALALLVAATAPRRRRRDVGGVALALLVNVPFWYPSSVNPLAPLAATIGLSLLLISGTRYLRRSWRRRVRITAWSLAGLAVLATLAAGAALGVAALEVRSGTGSARSGLEAVRNGDGDRASIDLADAQQRFGRARSFIDGPLAWAAGGIPGLAQQIHATQVGVEEGDRISSSAHDLVGSVDYDTLNYQGRLDLDQVAALDGPTARSAAVLATSEARLRHEQGGVLLAPLRDRLGTFADQIADARKDTDLVAALVHTTPGLLGGSGTRHYLVLFVTPAELRGAGGFIGSYAELTAEAGKVRLTRSGRIRDLIDGAPAGTRKILGQDDYVRRYGRFHPEDFLQDATFSPDFPTDAAVMAQLYPQSGGQPVDGVLSVDPKGLAALLRLTGPVAVAGLDHPLQASTAEEELLRTQYIDLPDEAERGDILTAATKATFERLTEGSLPAPRQIAAALSGATRSGHIRLWSPKAAEERLFRRLGADGSLRLPVGWDGFSVVQQNNGNNKLDAYLHRTISYAATVDARTGALEGHLRISLRNDAPPLTLPDAVVGNARAAPRGTNLATLTIYTRQVVRSVTIDGVPAKLGPDRELGLHAYDTSVLSIPPGGTLHLDVELTGGVDLRDGYRLRVVPQPVANPDRVETSLTIRRGTASGRRSHVSVLPPADLVVPTDRRVEITR